MVRRENVIRGFAHNNCLILRANESEALADGDWIVIELNDGQESGYAGVNRLQLWQKIIDIESGKE
jgi:hypothetical protein